MWPWRYQLVPYGVCFNILKMESNKPINCLTNLKRTTMSLWMDWDHSTILPTSSWSRKKKLYIHRVWYPFSPSKCKRWKEMASSMLLLAIFYLGPVTFSGIKYSDYKTHLFWVLYGNICFRLPWTQKRGSYKMSVVSRIQTTDSILT